MRSACVECHNTHPDTPKTGWKTGDLRGILEVSYPIEHASELARQGSRKTIIVFAPFILLGVLGIGFMGLREGQAEEEGLSEKTKKKVPGASSHEDNLDS